MTQASTMTPVSASTPQALIDLVRQAIDARSPIIDYGKAHQHTGHLPPAGHFLLDQSTPGENQGVIDHYDRDMTVRVEGGATLGQVQKVLAKEHQFIPIDADDDLSFSEIINANVYGPLRLSMGSVRDLLLGLEYIDGQARDIHVGGRTVKNVAGLDVTRLMVGSLGELGLIHQVILRTYAVPEQVLVVNLQVDEPALLDAMLTSWILTDASPASMVLHQSEAHPWTLRIAYHGRAAACASQLTSLQTLIQSHPGLQITGSSQLSLEQDFAEHGARRRWQREGSAVVKLVVSPARTGQVMARLHKAHHEQGRLMLQALPAHGCIFAGGPLDAQQARALNTTLDQIIAEQSAVRTWITRPADTLDDIEPFAPMPPALPWLLDLKKTMDPHDLFNPGRCLVRV